MLTIPVIDGAVFAGTTSLSATMGGVSYTIEGSNGLGIFDQVVTEVTPARASDPEMPLPYYGWSFRTFRLSGAIGGGTPRGPKGFLRVRTAPAP